SCNPMEAACDDRLAEGLAQVHVNGRLGDIAISLIELSFGEFKGSVNWRSMTGCREGDQSKLDA
ncbi:MAG: hypothetical protein ACPG5K_08715, partial [Glaciecola sp.]